MRISVYMYLVLKCYKTEHVLFKIYINTKNNGLMENMFCFLQGLINAERTQFVKKVKIVVSCCQRSAEITKENVIKFSEELNLYFRFFSVLHILNVFYSYCD